MIDLSRYPLDGSNPQRLQEAIQRACDDLARGGCARIDGFIQPEMRPELAAETDLFAPHALYSKDVYTPYGTPPDEAFPETHPRRRAHRTTSGNVTRDLISTDSWIQCLYCDRSFQDFVAACVDAARIYQFADPMRGLTINVMNDGNTLGWHFDANEFVVSLMTRRADSGGLFEYSPGLRSRGDENFDAVESVLDGRSDLVTTLDLQVGDLQIFKGRYSMHRVSEVRGVRHTVLFGYSREPGFIGGVASTMRVYGRVMQAHIDAEHQRHADGLTD